MPCRAAHTAGMQSPVGVFSALSSVTGLHDMAGCMLCACSSALRLDKVETSATEGKQVPHR